MTFSIIEDPRCDTQTSVQFKEIVFTWEIAISNIVERDRSMRFAPNIAIRFVNRPSIPVRMTFRWIRPKIFLNNVFIVSTCVCSCFDISNFRLTIARTQSSATSIHMCKLYLFMLTHKERRLAEIAHFALQTYIFTHSTRLYGVRGFHCEYTDAVGLSICVEKRE